MPVKKRIGDNGDGFLVSGTGVVYGQDIIEANN